MGGIGATLLFRFKSEGKREEEEEERRATARQISGGCSDTAEIGLVCHARYCHKHTHTHAQTLQTLPTNIEYSLSLKQ